MTTNNKSIYTCLAITLLLCLFAITTMALPTPAHIMLQDGHTISLSGHTCQELLFNGFNIDTIVHNNNSNNNNNADNELTTTTTTTIDPYDLSFHYPMENLQWWNFTDVTIDRLEMERCDVSRDIHGYNIVMLGVNCDFSGKFSYLFEQGFPVLSDDGKFTNQVTNATILARLDHAGRPDHHDDNNDIDDVNDNENDNQDNDTNHHDNDNNNEANEDSEEPTYWESDVLTLIPKMQLVTMETDYAYFYNNLIQEHDAELRTLLSFVTSAQIKVSLEDYCNVQHQCSDDMIAYKWGQLLNQHVDSERLLNVDYHYPTLLRSTNVIREE